MTISNIIKEFRKKNGLSQRKFAEMCGVSNVYIAMIEKENNPSTNQPITPSLSTLKKIADAMHMSIDDLINSADDLEVTLQSSTHFQSVGNVAAGYGIVAEENFEDDFFSIPESVLKGYSREDFMMLTVSGNSMYPYYQDGDHVLILRTPQCENGAIAVVYYGEEVNGTLKRVYFEGTAVRLKPLNPKYEEILIKGSDLDYFRIVGIPKFLARTM